MSDQQFIAPLMDDNGYYHIVYTIHNIINGNEYTGKHSTKDLNDGYCGSGYLIKNAIKTYGIENFAVEILGYYNTSDEAYNAEISIVDEEYVWRNDTYNIIIGGKGFSSGVNHIQYGSKHSDETKRKRNAKLKGRVVNTDTRDKLSATKRGKLNPNYGKTGKDNPFYGHRHSQETIDKMRNAKLGRKINHKSRTCPHCGTIGKGGSMSRWHFDNCKHK